jgi:hypothetical protein
MYRYCNFRSTPGLLLIACLISACGPVPKPQNAYADGRLLLQDLIQQRQSVRSFRMAGTLDHIGKHRLQGSMYVFAILPDQLRMDLLSPFGHTLSVLTTNPEGFGWSDYQNGRFYSGEASPCNVARFTGLELSPDGLTGILIGNPPIVDGPITLDWHPRGYYVITISGAESAQTLHVRHGSVPELNRAIFSRQETVIFDIRWNRWRTVSGIRVPEEVDIRLPVEEERIWIRYEPDGMEVNVSFPPNAFAQTIPAHLKSEILTCP